VILYVIVFCIVAAVIFHHVMLKIETKRIVPVGKMAEVNGSMIHVYSEGEADLKRPTLVIMSGSAMPSPVYSYKGVYSRLSTDYMVAVPEKVGYGYSDISDSQRDVKTMVDETRLALELTEHKPPYVLMPHSLSGIEALFWAQTYPQEIFAIVGLDMAMPIHYEKMNLKFRRHIYWILCFLTREIGVQRLPFLKTLLGVYNKNDLSKKELLQLKYLTNKMAINQSVYNETLHVLKNARMIKNAEYFKTPMLLFLSDGSVLKDWIKNSLGFANRVRNASTIELGCSHMMHNDCAQQIADKTKEFLIRIM